jgi:hypothetical protein
VTKQLTAHEVALVKIFCSDYDFRIPDYQRPYSWGEEQALQLIDDLVDALDRPGDEPYFLGSIVLVEGGAPSEFDVIDGQQRLTTLTILLAVLRELATTDGLAAELGRMIIEPGNVVQSLLPRPRLAPRDRDASFFRKVVQEPGGVTFAINGYPSPANDAQIAMLANVRALHGRLAGWAEGERLKLAQLLGNRTFLVVVSTPDLASAHRIFSVMNSRGLDLTPADIFKSDVIGALAGSAAMDDYSTKWEDAEQELGRDAFADLFLHIRTVFSKERAKRELLKEFPTQVLNAYLPDRAKEFIDDVVVPYARAYRVTVDADYSSAAGADAVNRWLRRLAQLDNNDWRPPTMWALRNHGDDPVWLNTFLQGLERLAASMLLRRTYATPRATRFIELLKDLESGRGLESPALILSDIEKAEATARLGGEIYLVTKVRKYVLLRLDEMLAPNAGVTYDHPVITVEHVLPQNPAAGSEWHSWFDEDARERWTHRLANLVLLSRSKNAEAQNYEFDKKKEKYFTSRNGTSAFALTTQVLTQPTWTPQVLTARQEQLMDTLRQGWGLK